MLDNKKILVTNDDGFSATGIKLLVEILYKYTQDIMVVAPKVQNSAVSQKLTLFEGLTINKEESIYQGVPTYSLDGTPTDCVKFALAVLDYKPDYIISGINQGLNLANDILYSGTVAACFEASLNNVKSIALSVDFDSFEAAKDIPTVLDYISHNQALKNKKILNINIPHNYKGIKVTHQGVSKYKTTYDFVNGKYYTRGHVLDETKINIQDETADVIAHENGYISITPLTVDRTEK